MSESQEPQAGSGVCVRCFLDQVDLARHDWEEHDIASPESREIFSGRSRANLAGLNARMSEYADSFVYVGGEKPDNRSGK